MQAIPIHSFFGGLRLHNSAKMFSGDQKTRNGKIQNRFFNYGLKNPLLFEWKKQQ